MEEAVRIAESRDRIHVKNTYHAWARKLEQNGDFREAAKKYEKANTHRYDVPRMLINQPELLDAYMNKTGDPYVKRFTHLRCWFMKICAVWGNISTILELI